MITTSVICVEWCLTQYLEKIRYRRYLCVTSSIFDTSLSVFASENIRICIRIQNYPYSNSNSNKNMKTKVVSVISIRIRCDYTPT
jgi:hypothetical protein